MHGDDSGRGYLRMYPKLMKWINQCIACQSIGYKPEMLTKLPAGNPAAIIKTHFQQLELSDKGLCDQCAEGLRQK